MPGYGMCHKCGAELEPVWFTEKEYENGVATGRVRRACSHLVCPDCGTKEAVDDTFDGEWRRGK